MKKLFLLGIVLSVILFTGCQKKNDTPQNPVSPPSTFSANIDAVFGETEMKARLTKHSAEKYEMQVLSPEILSSLNFVYENGICTVTYDGLTFESDLKRFPQSEIGAILSQALTDADNEMITKSVSEDGTIIYKGITDYGDFILTLDGQTMLWKAFSVDGASLKVTFSEYLQTKG